MKLKILIVLILGTIFIYGCKKSVQPDQAATIKLHECFQKKIVARNISLCFDSVVEDSRCPINVTCIWAGRAVAKFTFSSNNVSHPLTLVANSSPANYSSDTVLDGYTIRFINLYPHPGDGGSELKAEVSISQ